MYQTIVTVTYYDDFNGRNVTENFFIYSYNCTDAMEKITDYIGEENIIDIRFSFVNEDGVYLKISDRQAEELRKAAYDETVLN